MGRCGWFAYQRAERTQVFTNQTVLVTQQPWKRSSMKIYETMTCSHCGAKLYNFACHGCSHPLIKVSLNASRLHAGYIKQTITIHQASLWARVLHERRAESCGAQIASSKRAWPPLAPWTQSFTLPKWWQGHPGPKSILPVRSGHQPQPRNPVERSLSSRCGWESAQSQLFNVMGTTGTWEEQRNKSMGWWASVTSCVSLW